MLTEQIVDVTENGQLTIQLPTLLKIKKRVKVIINDIDDALEDKINLLKKAPFDREFMSDLKEVNKDFEFAESNVEE